MTHGIKTSITRIWGADGRVAGAGFLVRDHRVLTCAHVVDLALDRHPLASDTPQGQVSVDFPLLATSAAPQPAAVLRWLPETANGRDDIALLQLAADPPAGSAPVTLIQANDVWGHQIRVLGFSFGYDSGDWVSGRLLEADASRWLQIELDMPTGHRMQRGYSGAPVWDTQLSGIVGMMVGADRHPDAKVSYALPTAVLLEACPELAEESNPRLRVVEADALQYPAQVLVLKYAQAPYGVDAAVIERTGLTREVLPAPDEHLLVPEPHGVLARNLLFLGVVGLRQFGYRQIREFGHRALQVVSRELFEVSEVCLTLHGAGYGLDEEEAFEAEIAGVADAIAQGASLSLRSVTFIERDPKRANRMQQTLRRVLPDMEVLRGRPLTYAGAHSAGKRLRSVGYDSQSRPSVFVAMPFAQDMEDVFHYGIAPVIRSRELLCERADQEVFTGDVLAWITGRIQRANLLVADLSRANPNVYLEVGMAWGFGVPTVLLCDQGSALLFDVSGQKVLRYESIRDLESKLGHALRQLPLPVR